MTNFLLQPLGTVSQQWDVGDDDHNLFWFIFFCDTSYLSFLLYDLSFICFNLLFKTWYSGLIYVTRSVQSCLMIFRKRNRQYKLLWWNKEYYAVILLNVLIVTLFPKYNKKLFLISRDEKSNLFFAIKKDYEIKVISLMDVLKLLIAWWLILYGHKKSVF